LRALPFIVALIALSAFAEDESRGAQPEPTPTIYTSINGISIDGVEYWPFDDAQPGSPYPDRILWDYAEGSTPAKACMLAANRQLVSWLEDTNSDVYLKLRELKHRGGPSRFWMWTNDYTKAPQQAQNGMRRAHVWHWCQQHVSPDCGYLKFESTVRPDGSCALPQAEQVSSYLQGRINMLPENLEPLLPDASMVDGSRGDQSTDRENNPRSSAGEARAGGR